MQSAIRRAAHFTAGAQSASKKSIVDVERARSARMR
jgi:hypothetical protein